MLATISTATPVCWHSVLQIAAPSSCAPLVRRGAYVHGSARLDSRRPSHHSGDAIGQRIEGTPSPRPPTLRGRDQERGGARCVKGRSRWNLPRLSPSEDQASATRIEALEGTDIVRWRSRIERVRGSDRYPGPAEAVEICRGEPRPGSLPARRPSSAGSHHRSHPGTACCRARGGQAVNGGRELANFGG